MACQRSERDFAVPDRGLEHIDGSLCVSRDGARAVWAYWNNHLHLNLLPKTPEELEFAKEMYREARSKYGCFSWGNCFCEHGLVKSRRIIGGDVGRFCNSVFSGAQTKIGSELDFGAWDFV